MNAIKRSQQQFDFVIPAILVFRIDLALVFLARNHQATARYCHYRQRGQAP